MLSNSEYQHYQHDTTDNKSKYRNVRDYSYRVEIVEDSKKVVFVEAEGTKSYCNLNNLQHFHIIIINPCDVMHDLNEVWQSVQIGLVSSSNWFELNDLTETECLRCDKNEYRQDFF